MAVNTDKRFGVLVLPYEKRELSMPKEIMVDYDTGHIYIKNKDGTKILGMTKDIQVKLDNFISNAQNEIEVNVEGLTSNILKDALNELKSYTDAAVQGLSPKGPAKVICLENINIEGIPSDPIDDVIIEENDVVLLNGQTNKAQNGKWIVKAGIWERPEDFDENADFRNSAFIFIEQGTKYGDTGWVLTTDGEINIGVTELDFQIFSRAEEIQAGVGLVKDGNYISLESITTAGTGTKIKYDEYGRVISSETPTSFSDLGITDATPLSHIGKGDNEHAVANQDNHGFMSNEVYMEVKNNTQNIIDTERELLLLMSSKSEVELLTDEQVTITLEENPLTIVDNLQSTDANKALSANQGKVLNDKIDKLFTNNNQENPVTLNIWAGTLDQYQALANKDQNTLYYIEETAQQIMYMSTSGTDPGVIEELLALINELKENKANKSGDTFTGNVNFGNQSTPVNIEVFGDIYHKGKLLSELYAGKLHLHTIESIEGLEQALSLKANAVHTHNLSEMQQSPSHRTVTDEQIAMWTDGSSASEALQGHNTAPDAHTDIRKSIKDLNDKIYSDPVALGTIVEETIIDTEDVISIDIEYQDFDITKHLLLLYSNTTFVAPNRYSILDKTITFNDDELPIEVGTSFIKLIVNISGIAVGEINISDISKKHLSVELQKEINGKAEISHTHITSNINGLDSLLTQMREDIDSAVGSIANKVDSIPGKGLTSNDFTDAYLAQLNKNTETLNGIDANIEGKVNGTGNLYTDANINNLELEFPTSLEAICTALPDNSIVSCDAWILSTEERPELYGQLFIQKSNENRAFITFYKSLDDTINGFESWSCSFSTSNVPKVSKWEINVTGQLFDITGYNTVLSTDVTSADDLPSGIYKSNNLTNSPQSNTLFQYITYNWDENTTIQIAISTSNMFMRSKILHDNNKVWGSWSTITNETTTSISSLLNAWQFSSLNDNNISFIRNGNIVSVYGILIPGTLTNNSNICALPINMVPDKTKYIKVFDFDSDKWGIISIDSSGYIKTNKFNFTSGTGVNLLFNFTYQI